MQIWNFLGTVLLFVGFIFFAFFYLKSMYQVFKNVRDSEYSVLTGARVIGIFIVPLGFLLGFV